MNLSLNQNARGVSIRLDEARELSGKFLLQQGIQDAASTRLFLRNYSQRGIGMQALHLSLQAARSSTVIRYLLVYHISTLARSQRRATCTRSRLIVSLVTNKVVEGYQVDISMIAIEFEALDQRLH
jgi:lysine/ornithine N-monooxygenase